MKNRLLCLTLLFSLILGLLGISTPASADNSNNTLLKRQIIVQGNKLVYQDNGEHVVLRGLNVPSMEFETYANGGEHMYESLVEACDSWNSNIVRLPVLPKRWFDKGTIFTTWYNKSVTITEEDRPRYQKQYRLTIDNIIKGLTARGKYVIIDNHNYYTAIDEDVEFWEDMSERYGNNPNVFFGLLNEPVGIVGAKDPDSETDDSGRTQWDLWRNGGFVSIGNRYYETEEEKKAAEKIIIKSVGMQRLVEAIRDKDAKNVIIAAGLGWGYDLKGIVGKAFYDEKETMPDPNVYALTDHGSENDLSKTGYGIMYDSHIYPSKGHAYRWEANAGVVRDQYPLLIGEFGWDQVDNAIKTSEDALTATMWMNELKDWIDDTDGKYNSPANWTGWCFHPTSSPRVINGWTYEPSGFLGTYIKKWLRSYPKLNTPIDKRYRMEFDAQTTTHNTFNTETGIKPYKITNDGTTLTHTVLDDGNKLKITYNKSTTAKKAVDCVKIPLDWMLNGIQTLEFNLKASSSSGVQMRVGFEMSDTSVWTKDITVNDANDTRIVIPINELEQVGEQPGDGTFTHAVYNFYFEILSLSNATVESNNVEISNLEITTASSLTIPLPDPAPKNIRDYVNCMLDFETEGTSLVKNTAPASIDGEVSSDIGFDGGQALKIKFKSTKDGECVRYNFAEAAYPSDAKYFSFLIKGGGKLSNSTQSAPRTIQAQIAAFMGGKQVWTVSVPFEETNTEWQQCVYKIDDISFYTPAKVEELRFYSQRDGDSYYVIDNMSFTTEHPEFYIPSAYENGFEDTFLSLSTIDGNSSDDTMKASIDSGYPGQTVGHNSQSALKLTYTRPSGAAGSVAHATLPKAWNLSYISHFTFYAKSASGAPENISLGFVDTTEISNSSVNKLTTKMTSRSNREFIVTSEWQRFTVPLSDFFLYGVNMVPKRIAGIQIFNNQDDHSGGVYIDNIAFSNIPVPEPDGAIITYPIDPLAGTWAQDSTDATNNISVKTTRGGGFQSGNGWEFSTKGTVMSSGVSNRKVSLTGNVITDIDFSKTGFISFMVRGGHELISTSSTTKNTNQFIIQLYNKTTVVYEMTADAAVDKWSHIVLPLKLSSTMESNIKNGVDVSSIIQGINMLKIGGKINNQLAKFTISDMYFTNLHPERVTTAESSTYIDDMDVSTSFLFAPKYGSLIRLPKDGDGEEVTSTVTNPSTEYIYMADNGRTHYGLHLQHMIYTTTQPKEPTAQQIKDNKIEQMFVSAPLPLSWDIARTTHFQFDAKVLTVKGNGVSGNEWKYTDYAPPSSYLGSQYYGPATPASQPTDDIIRFALTDTGGNEYSYTKTFTNTSAWQTFTIPLNEFTNQSGQTADLSKIKQLRIYPEKYGTHSGMRFDNMGFLQENKFTDDIEVDCVAVTNGTTNLLTEGLKEGTATVTANIYNYTGVTNKSASVMLALYDKTSGEILCKTEIGAKNNLTAGLNQVTATIDVPESASNYIMKIFIWDSPSSNISPLYGYNVITVK